MSTDSRNKPRDNTQQDGEGLKRRDILLSGSSLLAASAMSATGLATTAQAQQQVQTPAARSGGQRPPNILFIMGDDIGWFNVGAYHRGMMSGKTPNLDKLASQGMLFTDYYAEASCTAGRAAFITGEIPLRTYLEQVAEQGYRGYVGLEYKATKPDTFEWLPRAERVATLRPQAETRIQ